MNRIANAFFNLVSLVFLIATIAMIVFVFSVAGGAMQSPVLKPSPTAIPPTIAAYDPPTPKPTWTPTITLTPTDTPTATLTWTPTPPATETFTPTPTHTLPPTITETPTITPTFTVSPTDTLPPPTFTPTKTLTPTPSDTPTFTPSPTGPTATPTATLSEFPFMVQLASPILRDNYGNASGCGWQGMAGQVTTDRGESVPGVQVRVRSDLTGELTTLSGTNTFYGPSGWELKVANQPTIGTYYVELWAAGQRISPTVTITFPGTCQQNQATINFIQTRPY